MRKELSKIYEPSAVEDRIYGFWEKEDCFKAEIDQNKTPYTIVIPPPNITGQLHLGHALDNMLQDVITRFRRMQGYSALWLPGVDHASIATEAKIVAQLKSEGLTKESLGREKYLERAWEWKGVYGDRIVGQLKKLGSSCDWSRLRFTMDEGCSKAVTEVFVRLFEKNLIYRGERIINWCPYCKTSISDVEVEYEDQQGFFWHLKYPIVDESGNPTGEFLQLATTRPETMAGDTGVAVHPEDERYKKYVGKKVLLPLFDREIPIVADDYVDREFGTGVVKITPAHDPNDFGVGQRHGLPLLNVMEEDGRMNAQAGKYAGMDRYAARKAMVADLEAAGYLVKVEPHAHNVGTCQRCHTTVEPRASWQWFVKMEPLAGPAIKAVNEGEVEFIPERMSKIYFNWMENIKDWCISRQLWWGHRIPAWHCADCGEVTVARNRGDFAGCRACGSTNLNQDADTLDTWFSSALWPFATLGWPEKTPDLEYFYPTQALFPGYDIIFFWVARMIFSAIEHTGEVPFKTVMFHGLVRDAQGRKMSKSLNNGIDPLDIIGSYGADALRFALATGNSPGNDMRYSEEKVKSSRNFANKLWNASRYVLMNLPEDFQPTKNPGTLSLTTEDKWVLSQYNGLVKEVTDNLEHFELGLAVQKLYDFIWDVYCDWYIELTKPRLQEGAGAEGAAAARGVLVYVLEGVLALLHPFMPFITEELSQALFQDGKPLMTSKFPVWEQSLDFPAEQRDFGMVISAIRAIRNQRAEMNVPPSKKASVYLEVQDGVESSIFAAGEAFFQRLAGASQVNIDRQFAGVAELENAVALVSDGVRIRIPMGDLVDREKELARLQKELADAVKEVEFISSKLENQQFIAKAPAQLVEKEREKLSRAEARKAGIEESLGQFK